MKIIVLFALALALSAETTPEKPKPLSKEESMAARIVELEKQNALAEARALRAKWDLFNAESNRLEAEWKKAAAKACGLLGIPITECQWQNDTIARLVPPPAPKPAQVAAAPAKPAPAAKK